MQTKYDEYMERELPYRMTLEELFEQSNNGKHYNDYDVLAYIRERGEKFTCLCSASTPSDMLGFSPLGMMVSGRSEKVPCRVYIDKNKDSYNPLFEDTIAGGVNHFSSTYKIQMTPIEFEGCVETFYFSDFVSMINDGRIILQEIEFRKEKMDELSTEAICNGDCFIDENGCVVTQEELFGMEE